MRSWNVTLRRIGPILLPLVVGLALLAVWPEAFYTRARFALHGFCAQNVWHSYWIDSMPLPYDGRENGMYPGALAALGVLAVRGRMLRAGIPRWPMIVLLAIGPAALAFDGVNSLLTDFRLPHPWTSTNASRLLSGYGTGIAIGVTLAWLYANTCYRIARRGRIVDSGTDLAMAWVPALALWVLQSISWRWLYVPIALLLIIGTWVVVSAIATVLYLLASKRDDLIATPGDLHRPMAIGGWVGLVVMIGFALGRMVLERLMDVPSTL